ncbi:MAG: cobalamin-binding protein [Betaproteobacteria bacterium]|nr:cobalamin-binding protein [Betaproteobacteria bacterium]
MKKSLHRVSRLALLCAAFMAASSVYAEDIAVTDDTGAPVRLRAPAARIVSLAPHATELLFAAGAGERIVGVVDFSNYPEAAKKLRHVGSSKRFDLEAVIALKPDLVVGWQGGNNPASLEKLAALGIAVYLSNPRKLPDISANIRAFGRLAGSGDKAASSADAFDRRLAALRAAYSTRPAVRVFYEVWNQPLTTIGGQQIISEALATCGGDNIFSGLKLEAPVVSLEAVLAADPEAIVASGMDEERPEWLSDWKRWPALTAVRRDNLFFVPPDLMQRATPRLLDGVEQLCGRLETARSHRSRP